MATSTVTIWHCDANGCDHTAPEGSGGWVNAAFTHGCPEHAAFITEHRARITSDTRGRGRNEKTTWFLRCDCGWAPRPGYSTHNWDPLTRAHLAHVKTATSREAGR